MMPSLAILMRAACFCVPGLLLSCTKTSISHRSDYGEPSTLSLQQLQDTDYDKSQITITSIAVPPTQPPVQQDLPKGQGNLSQTAKPGPYHIDLHYLKGTVKVLSTDFCAATDKKSQDIMLRSGANKLKIVVCTVAGTPVQDADVTITPIKKIVSAGDATAPASDRNATNAASARGAAIYASQCAACHGLKGETTLSTGTALQGPTCKSCSSTDALSAKIAGSMPNNGSPLCTGLCASDAATYILTTLH